MRSELVNSVCTCTIQAAPISVAFSTMKSVRAFLIGAKSSHRSGGIRSGRVCSTQVSVPPFLPVSVTSGQPFAMLAVEHHKLRPRTEAHDGKEVMRLLWQERKRLPRAQGLL